MTEVFSKTRGLRTAAAVLAIAGAAALSLGMGAALADDAKPTHDHAQTSAGETAAGDHADHGAHPAELSEASKAYDAVMHRMHKEMTIPYTNDVDVDFVRGMIPHHQGAIDQAQVLLKYSKNPRLRRLAGGIIAAQRREIRFMQNWLKEHQKGVDNGNMPNWLKSQPDPKGDGSDIDADDKP